MELPQAFYYGVCNLVNCKNVFIYMKPSKKSWEIGHLSGVGIFAWGVFLLALGGTFDKELF